MSALLGYGTFAVVLLICFFVFGIVISRLYTRSSKERAFIRTGLGGQKVVLSGGAIVLPIFHEIIWVNMSTLNLQVLQEKEKSLTTKDRLRVDVNVHFFLRVSSNTEAIANAAQTLGQRTLKPEELKELIEGKFIDALRSVATQMTMTELQDLRADFVQRVQSAVIEDLAKNGLELESASLTRLEQTRKEFFDQDNVFDAEGLTIMTRETEARRKLRNDIEQDTRVAIEMKNMKATEESLSISLQKEEATLKNGQDVARLRAEQEAEVARTSATSQRESEQAKIAAEQEIETSRITSQRKVAEADAERRKAVETANITTKTAIDIAAQEQAIAVANKSREQSDAHAKAEDARALSVTAEERVETARVTEKANRDKTVQVIQAQTEAEQASVGIIVMAEAELKSAEARAGAMRVAAQGESDAAKLRAAGTIAEGDALAQALREKNEAQNTMSQGVMNLLVKQETLRALPGMMAVMVKSIEKIDSIKVVELSGLGTVVGGNGVAGAASGNGGSLADQVGNVAMRYRTMGPMMDGLMAGLGLNGQNMGTLMESAAVLGSDAPAPAALPAPAAAEVQVEPETEKVD
jgi:uncharacterized membrane protein YqiK